MIFLKIYNKGSIVLVKEVPGLKAAKEFVDQNNIPADHKAVFVTEHINKITNETFENTVTIKMAI